MAIRPNYTNEQIRGMSWDQLSGLGNMWAGDAAAQNPSFDYVGALTGLPPRLLNRVLSQGEGSLSLAQAMRRMQRFNAGQTVDPRRTARRQHNPGPDMTPSTGDPLPGGGGGGWGGGGNTRPMIPNEPVQGGNGLGSATGAMGSGMRFQGNSPFDRLLRERGMPGTRQPRFGDPNPSTPQGGNVGQGNPMGGKG